MENGGKMEGENGIEGIKADQADNRNVIRLEELKDLEKGKAEEEKYLEDPDMKALIYAERGSIPSVILDEIYDNLRGRRVSKKQLKRILAKVKESLDTESKIEKIDDLYKKLDALEKLLRNFSRYQSEVADKSEIQPEKAENELRLREGKEESESEPEVESEFEGEFKGLKSPESLQEIGEGNGGRIGGIEMGIVNGGLFERRENAAPKTNGVKLTALPSDSKGVIFLLKWIEYLIERVGFDELENALDYYVDVGWISEDVLFSILRYAKGIKLYHEKSDWRPVGYLNVQDHIMSLMFIEALRTGKFSREKIMEVEREVFRMKREAMELNGI